MTVRIRAAQRADQSLVLTDRQQTDTVTQLTVSDTGALLLMAVGKMPAPDRDLWVVRVAIDRSNFAVGARSAGGVIS